MIVRPGEEGREMLNYELADSLVMHKHTFAPRGPEPPFHNFTIGIKNWWGPECSLNRKVLILFDKLLDGGVDRGQGI